MRLTGFFREFHDVEDRLGPAMNPPYEWQELIARYVERGRVVWFAPEIVVDPFNDTETAGMRCVVTDGEWIWPGELAHLVRRYGVMVPDEFRERMREHAWVPPEVDDATALAALDEIPDRGAAMDFPDEDPSTT